MPTQKNNALIRALESHKKKYEEGIQRGFEYSVNIGIARIGVPFGRVISKVIPTKWRERLMPYTNVQKRDAIDQLLNKLNDQKYIVNGDTDKIGKALLNGETGMILRNHLVKNKPEAALKNILGGGYKEEKNAKPIASGGAGDIRKGSLNNKAVVRKSVNESSLKDHKECPNEVNHPIDDLKQEAKMHSQVNGHKNIAKFLGFSKLDKYSTIMKYEPHTLEQVTMTQRNKIFGITPELLYGFSKGIAKGLAYLHSNNIMHLDLKPKNILVTNKGKPKITDFGSARSAPNTNKDDVGSIRYMAPEVMKQEERSFSADMFSLAMVTYSMLHGKEPHSEKNDTDVYMTIKRVDTELRPEIDSNVQSKLSKSMQTLWHTDPEKRPTAKQYLDSHDKTGEDGLTVDDFKL